MTSVPHGHIPVRHLTAILLIAVLRVLLTPVTGKLTAQRPRSHSNEHLLEVQEIALQPQWAIIYLSRHLVIRDSENTFDKRTRTRENVVSASLVEPHCRLRY